jgi:hypothetical protein
MPASTQHNQEMESRGDAREPSQMREFLSLIWSDDGIKIVCLKPPEGGMRQIVVRDLEEAEEILLNGSVQGFNAYHACATFLTEQGVWDPQADKGKGKWVVRTPANIAWLRVFWSDIDLGPKGYATLDEAWNAVDAFCHAVGLPAPLLIDSGGGTHIYWPLLVAIKYDRWLRVARSLKAAMIKFGLKIDPARTADGASILRPPETKNFKYTHTPLVEMGDLPDKIAVDELEEKLGAYNGRRSNGHAEAGPLAFQGLSNITSNSATLVRGRENRPNIARAIGAIYGAQQCSLDLISRHCKQVGRFAFDPTEPDEPDVYNLIGLAGYCEDAGPILRWIAGERAAARRRYGSDVEHYHKKWAQWQSNAAGPTTCKQFEGTNIGGCEGCPHAGQITSPAQLGRSSGKNGGKASSGDGIVGEQQPSFQQPSFQQPPFQRPPPSDIVPTAYVARDFATIPRRQWLYGQHHIRRYVSGTIAPGGMGKTAQAIVEGISMAIGKDLLNAGVPINRSRVWYWNGEDPREEMDRRIAAVCLYYNIDPKELEGWLFIDSGHDMRIKLAAEQHGEGRLETYTIEQICQMIAELEVDLVILDPFISTHMVGESNNTLIDLVIKALGYIANKTNCSIEIVHHTRKPGLGQSALTADDSRGGSAIVNGVRSVRVLNWMTASQAREYRIAADERFEYFEVTKGKPNMTARGKAEWRRLGSVILPNRGVVEPGDKVQVVKAWSPPAKQGVKAKDDERLRQIAATGTYRWDVRATLWFGHSVAEVVGLDVAEKKTIQAHMRALKARRVIATELRKSRKGEDQEFVIAGPGAKGVASAAEPGSDDDATDDHTAVP